MSGHEKVVARIGKEVPAGGVKAEKVDAIEHLSLPAALLLAADNVTDAKNTAHPFLGGIFLHATEGKGRVVSTDGARMFVASFDIEDKRPAWLKGGVLLAADGLRARVGMLKKMAGTEAPKVRIGYSKGAASVELSDLAAHAVFKVPVIKETFPDYAKVLASLDCLSLDEDGQPKSHDWQPVGMRSVFLKQTGEIAKILEDGQEKRQRSKLGMIVRAFNAVDDKSPSVFDFSSWPGAVLIVMPIAGVPKVTSRETVQLLSGPIKLTLAALRAHVTRNIAWAEAAQTEAEKAAFLAKAEGFRQRIEVVMAGAPSMLAIESQPDSAASRVAAEAAERARQMAEDTARAEAEAKRLAEDAEEANAAFDAAYVEAEAEEAEREAAMAKAAAEMQGEEPGEEAPGTNDEGLRVKRTPIRTKRAA